MTREEYVTEIRQIAELFNRELTAEQHALYYDKFQNISAKAFRQVVLALMDNCQKFPTRAEIVRVCSEQSAWNTDRSAAPAVIRKPPIAFECACGGAFTLLAYDLENADPGMVVKCVNEFYDLCHRKYDVGYLRHHQTVAGKNTPIMIGADYDNTN